VTDAPGGGQALQIGLVTGREVGQAMCRREVAEPGHAVHHLPHVAHGPAVQGEALDVDQRLVPDLQDGEALAGEGVGGNG
jgi:homogentisate 1,2-dioxygenase